MAEDSDENSGKVSEDRLNSHNDDVDADEGSGSKKSSSFDIKKFFKTKNSDEGPVVEGTTEDPVTEEPESKDPQKPEITEKKESPDEHHDLSFTKGFTGHAIFGDLKSHKSLILQALATLVGAVMIVYGMFLFIIPTVKVADNVMFGDESAFAVLLILLGVIVIILAFAKRLFGGTFIHNIHKEIEAAEKKINPDTAESQVNDSKSDSKSNNATSESDTKVKDASTSSSDAKNNNDKNNKDIRSED